MVAMLGIERRGAEDMGLGETGVGMGEADRGVSAIVTAETGGCGRPPVGVVIVAVAMAVGMGEGDMGMEGGGVDPLGGGSPGSGALIRTRRRTISGRCTEIAPHIYIYIYIYIYR